MFVPNVLGKRGISLISRKIVSCKNGPGAAGGGGGKYAADLYIAEARRAVNEGRVKDVIGIVQNIEDLTLRFNVFMDGIVPALLDHENLVAAKECLLIDCASTAREEKDYYLKTDQLIRVAEKSIEIREVMDAEEILDEAAGEALLNPGGVDVKNLERAAILLAKMGKEQKAIDLLTMWNISGEMSEEEFEDSKLRLIIEPGYCEKFFESQRDSLLPKIMEIFERKMDSWKDNGVNPSETKRVDLPILGKILKSSINRFNAAWELIDRMARSGIDPKGALHMVNLALENLPKRFERGNAESIQKGFKTAQDIDAVRKFVDAMREEKMGEAEFQEALWYEIPMIVKHFVFSGYREFSVFLLNFKLLYSVMVEKGFVLENLRKILPVLAQSKDPIMEMRKMAIEARKGIDPATILESE